MGSLKFSKLKSHITHVDTRFLREFVPTTMFRSKLFIEENGSNFCANHSQKDDQVVSKKSIVVLTSGLAEKESLELQRGRDTCGHIADAEDSVFWHSGLVANTSENQFMSGKSVSGYIEEPKTMKFMVQEIFVGSDESGDQSLDGEISPRKDYLEQKLDKSSLEFDEESESSSFGFELLVNSCCCINEDTRVQRISKLENIGGGKADSTFKSPCPEEIYEENENLDFVDSKKFRVEGIDSVEGEVLELKNRKIRGPPTISEE